MPIKTRVVVVLVFFMPTCWSQSLGFLNQHNPFDSAAHMERFPVFPSVRTEPINGTFKRLLPLVDVAGQGGFPLSGKLRGGCHLDLEKSFFFLRANGFFGLYSSNSPLNANGLDLLTTRVLQWDPSIRLGVKPTKYFNAQIGFDRNFYGEGVRSLFLSDFGKPYPFVSTRFNVGPISYQTMLSYLSDHSPQKKFKITHFLHGSIGKKIDVQLFEAVIFNSGDSLSNRSFDPAYLNPFIALRPQEYASGSGDNGLLGFGASVKTSSKSKLYGQFVIDDFLVSAFLNKSKYWGNKFGGQLGWKCRFEAKDIKYHFKIEANAVRPYTYAHLGASLNYAHGSQVLAHPLGANFWEIFTQFKACQNSWAFWGELATGAQGLDSSLMNFGSNLFMPYTNRPNDYGVSLLQGKNTSFLKTRIALSYTCKQVFFSEIFCELLVLHFWDATNAFTTIAPFLGIRSPIFNDYRF